MIVQDMTKFTLLVVLLGGILAIAIFRPQIIPVEPVQPTVQSVPDEEATLMPGQDGNQVFEEALPVSKEELEQREYELNERETKQNQRQAELDEREVDLDEREAKQNQRQAELDRRETDLNEHEVKQNQRQAELDGREAALKQIEVEFSEREIVLDQREAELDNQDSLVDKEWDRLWRWKADLEEREQKAQGVQRWLVVMLVVVGLLSVPSTLVFVDQMRQSQWTQASQTYQRERATRHGEPAKMIPTPVHSDNGRDEEGVEYCL